MGVITNREKDRLMSTDLTTKELLQFRIIRVSRRV
jgi:hypothetical protein